MVWRNEGCLKIQYFVDLSDFAKFSVRRALTGVGRQQAFRLGVVWYLTTDQGRDGRHIHYLSEPRPNRYSVADAHLYGRLHRILLQRLGPTKRPFRSTRTWRPHS